MTDAYVLREVAALDGSGAFTGPLDVSVEDGCVARVAQRLRARRVPSVDCAGLFLLPGIVDCHEHLAATTLDLAERLAAPPSLRVLEAAANARRACEAGVTLVRDPGGVDAGFRGACERGLVTGPRVQVAIATLSQTGGHNDGFLAGHGIELPADHAHLPPGIASTIVDGADAMRRTARALLRSGADWIKLCATGGVLAAHDDGDVAELTAEEIAVAVFEANRRGKPVMAHAFGGEGLDNAVAAGVRSIEHGLFLTEEQAARMAAAGCWLVPTLWIVREVVRWAHEGRLPDYATRKALALEPRIGEAVAIARAHGVRMAAGSDVVARDQHGRTLEELPLLCDAGLTPAEALLAATASGADLLGVGDRLGRIAPGYRFDVILLDGDPGDLDRFRRPGAVTGVFRDGAPVVAHPRVGEALGTNATSR